jgi:Protein of unknown function (DUF3144)
MRAGGERKREILYNSQPARLFGANVNDQDKHRYCTNKFIELANQLKDEKIDPALVSGALMTASGIYATYLAAGNRGALQPSGIDKVVALYRRTLEHHQEVKKAQVQPKKE